MGNGAGAPRGEPSQELVPGGLGSGLATPQAQKENSETYLQNTKFILSIKI